MSTDFNPDEFVLTSKDVLEFIDIVLNYWKRTFKARLQNTKMIGGMEMMKIGVKFQDEDEFKMIWSMLLYFINQLQYENAMQNMRLKDKSGKNNFGEIVAKLKNDLRNGGLEEMMEKLEKHD